MDLYDTLFDDIKTTEHPEGDSTFVMILFLLSWAIGVQIYWAIQTETVFAYLLRGEGTDRKRILGLVCDSS